MPPLLGHHGDCARRLDRSARCQLAPRSFYERESACRTRKRARLGPRGFASPNSTFWTAWDRDTLVAVGALKRLATDHGEVKSMHTASSARRKGTGSAMLQHIIAFARSRGISRLTLETGSWDYFQPAI